MSDKPTCFKCGVGANELQKTMRGITKAMVFSETIGKNVRLYEYIYYYPYSGNISVCSSYIGNHKQLYVEDI